MESKQGIDPRFPIGDFDLDVALRAKKREEMIETIRDLPSAIESAVEGLSEAQLDEPYRDGGWTIRQVVHHVADSHINSFSRFKLALTEDLPTIRAYFEDKWAELPDSKGSVGNSLDIIRGVHARWAEMLSSMDESDFSRRLNHPETGEWDLKGMLALYDWHSRHHTAHITSLRKRKGW
ncbi:MAG: putative metal-dependent hydrolase [Pyrinomonadaceae bacterium]|nr:putative metal-dependent hydrolase [Pyrinomonadaceae bacterium]